MQSIGRAIVLAAALSACGRNNSSPSATGSAYDSGGRQTGPAESKLAMPPAAPATGLVAARASFGGSAEPVSSPDQNIQMEEAPVAQAVPDRLQSFTTAVPSTMMIRTGQALVEVEKLDPAISKIRLLVGQAGGYITSSSITGGRDQIRQASIEIKIPNTRYDETVASLASIGKVQTVNSSAQDVGEEFVDVTARVANARRLEERLIDLLARRTGKLEEVLRVERELARVREEIERYEGRLRYLTSRVAMSTLTINIHEPAPIIDPGSSPIADAFRRAWQNFVALLAAVIASLGLLIPVGLAGAAGWAGYRRWLRAQRPVAA